MNTTQGYPSYSALTITAGIIIALILFSVWGAYKVGYKDGEESCSISHEEQL